jgi:ubiquinone/menaquinone biosynthesis C-methylase UbiE
MVGNISERNRNYWQNYKPGEIPSFPALPPKELLNEVVGPVLDVGTGDGKLAEELSANGLSVFAIDIARNIIEENIKRETGVRYSTQDIADKTTFADNYFGLLLFKFVLTNIHKESWRSMSKELDRILRLGGKIWILEPLVSDSYESRYRLASHFLSDSHCIYVFNDKNLAEQVDTPEKE